MKHLSLSLALLALAVPGRQGAVANEAELPIREIILYTSGLGFFQHEGEVEGRAEVELRFRAQDINDLLKSLVLIDRDGGTINAVSYDSHEPLTRRLQSFAVDLTGNPGMAQILNQVRGARIEIRWPNALTGTVLGVEARKEAAGEGQVMDAHYVNLLTEAGLQSIPLKAAQQIRFLDERLQNELRQALEILAGSHDTGKRSVKLSFEGEGRRRVNVGYIAQSPVWKTSYRLVMGEDAPYLQGWAIVENTTDFDWEQARLSLVSGRPIAFQMNLYEPLFVERPTVELELYASLRPPVHHDAMERFHGPGQAPPAAAARQRDLGLSLATRGGIGGGGFAGGQPLLMESLAEDRMFGMADISAMAAAAQGAQTGELFQYQISAPVTLPRQRSAMLPIVSQEISGEKFSIYNQSVQQRHPLHGFKIRNTSSLYLMQGPITVFEEGSYAGDARIEDIGPGQERLISYALDLNVEVEPRVRTAPAELVSVAIQKGTLITRHRSIQELDYYVRNRDGRPRQLLIEHPISQNWELVSTPQPLERTRNLYRFLLEIDPQDEATLPVRLERLTSEHIQMADLGMDIILFHLRAPQVNPEIKKALQQVVALRQKVEQTVAEKNRREQRVAEISQDQARIRENMGRLSANSDLYMNYVRRLDQQERELDELRADILVFRETEARQREDLREFLGNLEIDA